MNHSMTQRNNGLSFSKAHPTESRSFPSPQVLTVSVDVVLVVVVFVVVATVVIVVVSASHRA